MKNYAFIDSQNVNLEVKRQGWRLDFRKFRIYLRDKYKVKKAFLFIGYVDGNSSLYEFLQEAGYILIFKPTLKLPNNEVKGNVDAELVLHAMIQYPNYDKAVIVSNDGDFHCLVEHLEKQRKLFKLITPSNNFSSLLRKFAKYIVPIPLFRNKVELNKKKGHSRGQN